MTKEREGRIRTKDDNLTERPTVKPTNRHPHTHKSDKTDGEREKLTERGELMKERKKMNKRKGKKELL